MAGQDERETRGAGTHDCTARRRNKKPAPATRGTSTRVNVTAVHHAGDRRLLGHLSLTWKESTSTESSRASNGTRLTTEPKALSWRDRSLASSPTTIPSHSLISGLFTLSLESQPSLSHVVRRVDIDDHHLLCGVRRQRLQREQVIAGPLPLAQAAWRSVPNVCTASAQLPGAWPDDLRNTRVKCDFGVTTAVVRDAEPRVRAWVPSRFAWSRG